MMFIWSITRSASTTFPARLIALNLLASSGAFPIKNTCRPTVSTSAHVAPPVNNSFLTWSRDVFSIKSIATVATSTEVIAAEKKEK